MSSVADGFLLRIERPRTTDEQVAPNVESQQGVGGFRDADPFAQPDFAVCLTVGSYPQRTGLAQVDPVQPAINPQGHGQPPWPPTEISQRGGFAVLLHERDAIDGLDGPDQHTRSDAGRFARHVQHERDAVGEINISVPVREEKCPVARGHAAIGVTGGVADRIGLGLDDAAMHDAFSLCPHEYFADEKTREFDGIDG
jgi:hypothetical protein